MSSRSLHFSDQFAISCGTVSVDIRKRLLLAVLYRRTGEYLIPKGRKDVGESLEQTALRETFEETGYRPRLLPHALFNLATTPKAVQSAALSTEPFAVNQRITADNTLKIIFWYAAQVDSEDAKVDGTQDEGEEFDTAWIPFDDVTLKLSFDDDRDIAMRVVEAVQREHES